MMKNGKKMKSESYRQGFRGDLFFEQQKVGGVGWEM